MIHALHKQDAHYRTRNNKIAFVNDEHCKTTYEIGMNMDERVGYEPHILRSRSILPDLSE